MANPLNLPEDQINSYVRKLIQQPYSVIKMSPNLFRPHQVTIDRDVWILANLELMKQVGPYEYLDGLLKALEDPLTEEQFKNLSEEDAKRILNKKGVPSPYH